MEQEPVNGLKLLSLPDAKRSWLMQLEGIERYKQEVFGKDPANLPQDQIDELFAEGRRRWDNMQELENHIDDLEYRAEQVADQPIVGGVE